MSGHKTLKIFGAGLADQIFATDPAIFGSEIVWNITRIGRDAEAGRFGNPHIISMSVLPPMSSLEDANIDWAKVSGMVRGHGIAPASSPVNRPVLQVMVENRGRLYRIPVDGNHRLCARRIIGLSDFSSYVVPVELEARYRVTQEIL